MAIESSGESYYPMERIDLPLSPPAHVLHSNFQHSTILT